MNDIAIEPAVMRPKNPPLPSTMPICEACDFAHAESYQDCLWEHNPRWLIRLMLWFKRRERGGLRNVE